METLTQLTTHAIMLYLNHVDCRSLRCVSKHLSTMYALSPKRSWFSKCVFCGIKLQKLKDKNDISYVFGKTYLQKNINLECGCRCHRDCYAISLYTSSDNHICPNMLYKTVIPKYYVPQPLISFAKKLLDFKNNMRKWAKYVYKTNLPKYYSNMTRRVIQILRKMNITATYAPVCIWLQYNYKITLELNPKNLASEYVATH